MTMLTLLFYPVISNYRDGLRTQKIIAINQDPAIGTSVTPFRWVYKRKLALEIRQNVYLRRKPP